ncbi:ATP phosphoribosyltransferase regulatory subunit [Burkholderiaceae bacterium DAT-1]|nr:ATP phosphoribosyltransferase regulatory subunit [Burkholderiaceae bacterium DAT-1]
MRNWILPENTADLLPPQARRVELLRRSMLDRCAAFGYELVLPPLLEYVESLVGEDDSALDMKTYKLMDQLSGRQLGLRADITPQVARIDAHLLNRQGVARLCYAAPTVQTLPDGIFSAREPLQLGAEIYGHAGVEADAEVLELAVDCLSLAEINVLHIDIGHVGFFAELAQSAGLSAAARAEVFNAIQQKDTATLKSLTAAVPAELAAALQALPALYGDASILDKAAAVLPATTVCSAALCELRELAAQLQARGITVSFDLSELRSGFYHTGLVFTIYAEGWPNAIARGGRYDHAGARFGRSRPATGFSIDIKEIADRLPPALARPAILAPSGSDPELLAAIRTLRQSGETVVVRLGDIVDVEELHADRILVRMNDQWGVQPLVV